MFLMHTLSQPQTTQKWEISLPQKHKLMQGAPNEDQTKTSTIIQKQKCPRCESSNTKFCYYNNYSLSQPRYFCKSCRRYWTHGGTLRNVPIGGGSRKSKRPKTTMPSSSASSDTTTLTPPPPAAGGLPLDHLATSYSSAAFLPSLDVGAYSFGGLPWTTSITNTIIHSSSSGNNQNSSLDIENNSCTLLPNHLPPYAHPPWFHHLPTHSIIPIGWYLAASLGAIIFFGSVQLKLQKNKQKRLVCFVKSQGKGSCCTSAS